MSDDRQTIELESRETFGSREGRRLRKSGNVPGILYGRGRDPQAFSVNEHDLRATLKSGHALFDANLAGDSVPVIVKDQQHHPVRGDFTHIDLLEVDLKQAIQSLVSVELSGVEEAPGVVQGGVLELNQTFMLSEVTIASELTVLDDAEETVIATITPPSQAESPDDEVEEETELVGEGEAPAEGDAEESEGGDE
jgi:large subunit ribosomal protein L25